jgi:valacyclovir hydrolase
MPKLVVNGFSMYYETYGSGDPIVFIPGALGTGRTDFEHQLPWFSQTYQVIAPDPRGYGESRPPERDYPLTFYQRDAEDMLALMTELGHQEFAVFGWSDGANTGALMAAHSPQRVRRLVMWGGNSYLSAEEIAAFQAMRSLSSWSPREVAAMRQTYGDSLDGLWERYVVGLEGIYAAGGDIYRRNSAGYNAQHSSCTARRIRWYHGSTQEPFVRVFAGHPCMFFLKASTGSMQNMQPSLTN